eukprot:COSAG02_NODE_2708_length_8189_cov_3.908282_3_plen_90_part_00
MAATQRALAVRSQNPSVLLVLKEVGPHRNFTVLVNQRCNGVGKTTVQAMHMDCAAVDCLQREKTRIRRMAAHLVVDFCRLIECAYFVWR